MVTSQSPRRFRPSRLTVVLTGLGLLMIVVYRALILFGVGNVGEPTDIGGSALLLAGFVILGIAVILGIVNFVRR